MLGYLTGLAILLTATSFFVAGTDLVWQPHSGGPRGACDRADGRAPRVLPHLTTGPDNTNSVLELAFGLIVLLVIVGSLWIMANLNHNMMLMDQLMRMQG